MAEVKWIKLMTDMFDNSKIKYLRTLPEGNNIVLFWVMLLAKAGKCNSNGFVFLTENIPYTQEMLASEFGFELNTVKLSLESLSRLNMIQLEQHSIEITGWNNYQNIDGLEKIREQTRKRVANYRKKQKSLMESNKCQYCGNNATGYDHIIPISRGGKDIDENKIPCCIDCNRIKNDKPLVDFLNNNREIIDDDLIKNNIKLSKHVTLSNVTGRYEVTECNATEEDIDIEEDKNKIDINIFIEKWNSLGVGKIISIKNQRLKHLKARIEEYSVDEVLNVIDKVKESRFLQGDNDRGWRVDFDWIVNPNNFTKVLEDKYKDIQVVKSLKKGSPDNFNNFQGRDYNERYQYLMEQILIGQATEEEKEEFEKMKGEE